VTERIDRERGVQHMQIINAKRIRKCECTCHVYGQQAVGERLFGKVP